MKPLMMELDITCPAALVFAIASDVERFKERAPAIVGLEILSETRSGLGTRWKETRMMFGKSASETMEITEWRPPHEYVVGAESCGCRYRTVIRVVPTATGSRLEAEFTAEGTTLVRRVMGAIMLPLMRGMMRKMFMADFEGLKRACEAAAPNA